MKGSVQNWSFRKSCFFNDFILKSRFFFLKTELNPTGGRLRAWVVRGEARRVVACVLRGAVRRAARVTADERCVGAQRPKRCKPVQATARVACAVPPARLARGGTGHATRAPSVQRANMGGVCKQARYCPCCGADAAAHQQQCDEQCSNHDSCNRCLEARGVGKSVLGARMQARGKLFSHSPKRSLTSRKHRVGPNNSNNRRVS